MVKESIFTTKHCDRYDQSTKASYLTRRNDNDFLDARCNFLLMLAQMPCKPC